MPEIPLLPTTKHPSGKFVLTITALDIGAQVELDADLENCSPDIVGQIHGVACKEIMESLRYAAMKYRQDGVLVDEALASLFAGYERGRSADDDDADPEARPSIGKT